MILTRDDADRLLELVAAAKAVLHHERGEWLSPSKRQLQDALRDANPLALSALLVCLEQPPSCPDAPGSAGGANPASLPGGCSTQTPHALPAAGSSPASTTSPASDDHAGGGAPLADEDGVEDMRDEYCGFAMELVRSHAIKRTFPGRL